jgi:hypothetical protein
LADVPRWAAGGSSCGHQNFLAETLACVYRCIYSEAMNTYTCDCKVCEGITFTTTRNDNLTPTMIHNYARMVANPPMVNVMRAKGFERVA